jgi:hypothetical protein
MQAVYFSGVSQIRDLIVQATDPWGGIKPKDARRGVKEVHQMLNGIYLSTDASFVEVCQKDNPHKFESVISACGFPRVVRAQPSLAELSRKDVETNFTERNITWLQIGDAVPDDRQAWTDIVFNATFPDSPHSRADYEIENDSITPLHIAFRAMKKEEVLQTPPEQWFEPTFTVLRSGVDGKKTLLHCHLGISRSSTILSAFLIKEFKVSAAQAIAFLRTRRYCINPKSIAGLEAYAKALNH